MPISIDIDTLINQVIARKGAYSDHPADRDGPTRWGIAATVPQPQGYGGAMHHFARAEAAALYKRIYWLQSGFDRVAQQAPDIAADLIDRGINIRTGTATRSANFPQNNLAWNNMKFVRKSGSLQTLS